MEKKIKKETKSQMIIKDAEKLKDEARFETQQNTESIKSTPEFPNFKELIEHFIDGMMEIFETDKESITETQKRQITQSRILFTVSDWLDDNDIMKDSPFNIEEIKKTQSAVDSFISKKFSAESELKASKEAMANTDIDDDDAFAAARQKCREKQSELNNVLKEIEDAKASNPEYNIYNELKNKISHSEDLLKQLMKEYSR